MKGALVPSRTCEGCGKETICKDTTYGRLCLLCELRRENDVLRAECKRHRDANLVRNVRRGVTDEWIIDYINREDFDAIPWRIAAQALDAADNGRPSDG